MYKFGMKARVCMCMGAVCALALTGCGKGVSKELDDYKAGMTQFYDKLTYYDSSINGIDASSENAKTQLLGYLDEMNESYKTMAAITVPEEFSGIADISVEAADYMQKANECYHLAYDGAFSEENEQLASQYYQRANNRAMVMLKVLHGEIPEGEGVVVTTQEPGEFATINEDDN